MALVIADRVKETSLTTGTSTIVLAGAAGGFQAFSVIGNGNSTYYCIAGQGSSEWEVGIGTYTLSGTTLSRDTVLSSSAGGTTKVTFSSGTKDVFVTYPSEKSVNLDASGNATALGTPVAFTGTNITGTATAFTAGHVTTNANLTGGVTSVGNAATVITNANLTGPITSVGNATSIASQTGTGSTFVMNTSPTLVTPALGTPTALVGTNISGTATAFTASNVTTNANLTGGVTSVGNAATVVTNANLTGEATSSGNAVTLTNSAVIGKVLTGYVSGAGTVAATDTILQAVQKLNGNAGTFATLGANTFTGAQTLSDAAVLQYGSATSVIQTNGTDYQSRGTVIIPHDHVRFIHTYRPLGTAQGGTATFSTDGANTFVGDRSGNFTMTPDAAAVGNPDIQCSYNAGFGTQALGQLTTGYNNAACGVNAGRYTTQGYSNAFFGRDAAELTATGSYNVAVGQSALHENISGAGNIAVGGKAGYDSITGDYNTYIGFTASGTGITSGSDNTIIGSRISALGNVSKNIVLASGDGVIRQHTNASGNTSYGSSFTPIATGQFRGAATTNGTARRVLVVDDDSAIAAGIGGGISFRFIYTGTTYSEAANIKASKDNATSGNYAGSMVFSTQAHGASPAEAGRFTSTKDFLLTAGTGGIGYGTGSGGTVTQATSRTTGVTLNKPAGQITMFSAAGSVVAATFTVTNTVIAATDTVVLSQKSGTNLYVLLVTAVAAGSFNITFYTTGGVATDSPVINYTIIRGVTS